VSTVDQRAQQIYDYLSARLGQRFSLPVLCQRVNLEPGAKTTVAIRRARDIADANGLHLPPATPQNHFTYTVTAEALDAVAPAVQMSRIAEGVERRAGVGYDFAEAGADELPPRLREAVLARQEAARLAAQYVGAMNNLVRDVAAELRTIREEENGHVGG
jgi:hypothetical protein